MTLQPLVCAYYYPGWHACPVRDAAFPQGWSEWDLVYNCRPRFAGHQQPNLPAWGRYDESLPETFTRKVAAAREFGVDAFVFAFYWSRGKQLLTGALNQGFLECPDARDFPFALMWANRMPRKVLPVRNSQAQLIDPHRLVYTDPDDFIKFVQYITERYFVLPNYLRLENALYLSIFDTSFFLRQMGCDQARSAIAEARRRIRDSGLGELHLAAIDPIPQFQADLKGIGFDSVTHYVFLPDWKGPLLQDFSVLYKERCGQWSRYPERTGLPYFPSVSPGWDANPRGSEFGTEKPQQYPWSPIVVNRDPAAFSSFLGEAVRFSSGQTRDRPPVFIASWNEWSEGHYLEPDTHFGCQWLEGVSKAVHGR